MRFLVLSLALSFFSMLGCTSTPTNPGQTAGCAIEQSVTGAFSAAIASSLQCQNTAQIQQDVLGWLGKANLCTASAVQAQLKTAISHQESLKGIVGNIVCPLAVDAVFGGISGAVPSTWQCDPKTGTAGLSAALAAACAGIVPI